MTGVSDHELVAKALQGNQKAFRAIVERHHATAYSVVRAILGDRDDVDDVLQNVYIKIYRGLAGFRGDARLSTWIYQIARNEAINAARRRRPDTQPIEEIAVAAPESSSPEAEYGRQERGQQLEKAMAGLEEDYRVALELRYMGERSYEEIAEVMGLPLGTVKTYIHRGKAQLRRAMARHQQPVFERKP